MSDKAEVIDETGEQVTALPTATEKPAWQDEAFMGKVQRLINGDDSLEDSRPKKILEKIKESIQVVQKIKQATETANKQVQEATLQAERAEGQTQGYLSVLRDMLEG